MEAEAALVHVDREHVTNGYLHDLDGALIGDEPSITVTNP